MKPKSIHHLVRTGTLAAAIATLLASHAAQATLTWNLTTGGDWDDATTNWTADGGATTTNFTDDGSVDVIFDKTNGGTITTAPDMSPLSTTVSAASGTYVFSGGPIDSGTLSKSGAGILTLSGANSFSGVTLSGGQLNINNAGALGTGTFAINGGTTINNTSGSAKTLSTVTPIVMGGDFSVLTSGDALNLGSGAVTLGSTVILRGNSLSTARSLTIGGNITGGANGLQVIKGAFVVLAGTNSYSGATAYKNFGNQLSMIRADNGVGLPAASNLAIETAGVFETGADLVRVGGTGAGQMHIGSNLKNDLGFSAFGGPVKICFGTLASPTALTWGSAPFNPGGFALILNHTTANNTLDFRNPVNLNAAVRKVLVDANVATMSGNLTGTGISGLSKTGAGTLALSGINTYNGATNVSAGTLNLKAGSLANTAIAVTGTGTLAVKPGAASTFTAGNTATAAAGASLNLGGRTFDMTDDFVSTFDLVQESAFAGTALTITSGATLKFNLDATGADLLAVAKAADVSGTVTVTLDTTGAVSLATGTHNLVTAESGLTSSGPTWQFTGGATQTVTVGGNDYDLTFNPSDTAISVTVASTGGGSAYDTWAAAKGLTGLPSSGTDPASSADPDKDGRNNLAEFAFNGDPLSGADNGRIYVLSEDSDFDSPDAQKELILTVAVRAGTPAFAGSPSPTSSQDGISYTIEGSLTLGGFATAVNVVPTPVTIDGSTPLPAAGAGYVYRSFSLSGSNGLPGKGFLRAKVTQP